MNVRDIKQQDMRRSDSLRRTVRLLTRGKKMKDIESFENALTPRSLKQL